MNVDEKLLNLIENENKLNALTDDQIANLLTISRQEVIKKRKQLNIPSYNKRRLPFLKNEITNILSKNSNLSERELTKIVQGKNIRVSKFLVSKLKNEILNNQPNYISHYKKPKSGAKKIEPNSNLELLNTIIGANGSIAKQVQQAEAAVLYPPHGLHTLIIGQTGTGKTQLAEFMYKLALKAGRISKGDSFVRFNCADYSNNPQLLLSQLFGHIKGAFTGADCEKKGLIEKADGGILFLDEIHRLPQEGQEILFTIIDKKVYRKLGETGNERKVNVMIIGATTENINSNLSLTFRRRIPMVIELPPLSKRGIDERYNIIVNFFKKESDRIGVKMNINSEVICALLLYECIGNIGQLRSDIQVACARAYLKFFNKSSKCINIDISDFNISVQQGLYRKKYSNKEILKYIDKGITVTPEQHNVDFFDEKDIYVLPNEIYKFIEERYKALQDEEIPHDLIYNIISRELESRLQRAIRYIKESNKSLEKIDIAKIVGQQIVETVEEMLKIGTQRLGMMDNSIFYCLALHLSDTVERIKQNKPIFNPQLEYIKERYPLEFKTAREMLDVAKNILKVDFPEDEIGFIALYIRKKSCQENAGEGLVKIIVITHGNVGLEMAKLANTLIGYNFVKSICMPLDQKPEIALKATIELCKKINEGKGILFLVDMGSLLTFGELVTKETGIPTKTIGKVYSEMVLDAGFKAINNHASLEDLAESLEKHELYIYNYKKNYKNNHRKAIIALCITGEGAAINIKRLLEDVIPEINDNNIEIIPIGMIQSENVIENIKIMQKNKDIIAIVGTINPNVKNIPYYSMEKILNSDGLDELKELLFNNNPQKTQEDKLKVKLNDHSKETYENKLKVKLIANNIFDENLIVLQASLKSKEEVLDTLSNLLLKYGYVKESFLLDLYKRELMAPTIFANGIAIPHAFPFHVIKPAIAIATLKKPVKWAENFFADKIFMFALNNNSSLVFRYLYNIGNNYSLLDKLIKCSNKRDFLDILLFNEQIQQNSLSSIHN